MIVVEEKKSVLDWALEYAARGWQIFPLHTVHEVADGVIECSCARGKDCTDAGKHPRHERGLKAATNDEEKVREWFGWGAPPSNIGVLTGQKSGITVIDIDIAEGKLGAESWAEVVAEGGEPETLCATTGSGGMHLVFKYNSALKTAGNVLGKGIDCRNDGGYIVVAPSAHRSGGVYEWNNWGVGLADLPAHMSKKKDGRGRPRKDDMFRGKYSIEQVKGMLEFVDPSDRDMWRNVGIILGREFKRIESAWELYGVWSDRWGGTKGRNHDEIMHEAFYELSLKSGGSGGDLTLGTIVRAALEGGWVPKTGEVPIGHFVFYGPGNNYIYRPTTSFWIAPAVDAAVSPVNENGKIVKASDWLRLNELVTSMTVWPGEEDDVIKGKDCRNGQLVPVPGSAVFNAYKRPTIELGDARLAGPFVEHVRKVFNKEGDADQFLNYMAHRVQKPWEKPRFALLLAGDQGVGKDTAVEFCVPAIGSWNVANIEPAALEGSFNEYVASTLVRISEAANLHEMTKWAFNEKTKVLIAGTPDEGVVNPKYGQKYSVRMYCGVVITTNHLANGIYIPEGDRRYDVIASASASEMGLHSDEDKRKYFGELWDWFLDGGNGHVAAFLHERKLDGWSASNGQRKTDAHRTVVVSGMVGDHWLQDALDEIEEVLGENFGCVRADWIVEIACKNGEMKPVEARAKLLHAIKRFGFEVLKSDHSNDGRFKFGRKNVVVYKRQGAPIIDVESLNRELF